MKPATPFSTCLAGTALLLILGTASCLAAASVTAQIDPPEANIGDEVTVTITVKDGNNIDIHLPPVDGLLPQGTSTETNITFNNGAFSSAYSESFHLQPTRAGDFTIPAFDIHLPDGGSLHVQAMKLHVLSGGNGSNPSAPVPNNVPPANAPSLPNFPPAFNPSGPVVMPPANNPPPDANGNTPDTNTSSVNVPTDSDGRPAKVFVVITPQTTDAYVGQSIPLTIQFYIRLDVAAQQDSLPTIKGSDFLMNNLSVRPGEEELALMNEGFHRETWVTAISAPKSGDFPLQMERDTYWVKSTTRSNIDPFGNFFFNRPNLAHESIASNQLTIHVHPLPQEGRPANFSGAIGHFKVSGSAQPGSVAVGEPVTLSFIVSGDGNFDYVRCPSLSDDPAWKKYASSNKVEYQDQDQSHTSHTEGVKTFEQAVIPQKGGDLPLPQASFSYFDPTAKQYVTEPINLPDVTVTGSATLPATPASGASANGPTTAPPSTADFLPNHLALGSLTTSLTPPYRQTWFWSVQGGLTLALLGVAVFTWFRPRNTDDAGRAERLRQQHSLQQETDAMSEAVQRGDAQAFFLAARHAVQLRLGSDWRLHPEALTLAEIRQRDPALAESLEPLFAQADEVIYSGRTSGTLDLAQWERHVRDLLQPQTA